MSLEVYRRKRDFGKTPEPSGRVGRRSKRQLAFVVQKHQASHLHYDFRLELDGVLLSWAVPKGPSLDPRDKRLAMQTEDHPLDYGDFEGIIPPKQYGAGTVIVWDRGTWTPKEDPREGYRKGKLKFTLGGEKLHGGWVLVRSHGKYGGRDDGKAWLLMKERDDEARSGADANIVEQRPESVLSDRVLEDVARAKGRVWHSNKSVATSVSTAPKASASTRPRGKSVATTIAGVTISNPDKVLFPDIGVTKRELCEYFEAIAPLMLPHLTGRPLSLVRCPDGARGKCFYQKHAKDTVPAWVDRVEVLDSDGPAEYMMANNAKSLVTLAQLRVIEMHPWGSRKPKLEFPDRLIFDLDPDDALPWKAVREAALLTRGLLDDLKLTSFLKTTGGKGLHVVVPVTPSLDWDEAKAFVRDAANVLVRAFPDRFTSTVSKSARGGKIFIDYLRNAHGATAIAPYGVRARDGAPIAVPVDWSALDEDIRYGFFNVRSLDALLRRDDPWKDIAKLRQRITAAMRKRVAP